MDAAVDWVRALAKRGELERADRGVATIGWNH
jgi:hypothetical protein